MFAEFELEYLLLEGEVHSSRITCVSSIICLEVTCLYMFETSQQFEEGGRTSYLLTICSGAQR